jgi:hypothetical protein
MGAARRHGHAAKQMPAAHVESSPAEQGPSCDPQPQRRPPQPVSTSWKECWSSGRSSSMGRWGCEGVAAAPAVVRRRREKGAGIVEKRASRALPPAAGGSAATLLVLPP